MRKFLLSGEGLVPSSGPTNKVGVIRLAALALAVVALVMSAFVATSVVASEEARAATKTNTKKEEAAKAHIVDYLETQQGYTVTVYNITVTQQAKQTYAYTAEEKDTDQYGNWATYRVMGTYNERTGVVTITSKDLI